MGTILVTKILQERPFHKQWKKGGGEINRLWVGNPEEVGPD